MRSRIAFRPISLAIQTDRGVETLSGGRLGVRSLREPEVRALLDRARPG